MIILKNLSFSNWFSYGEDNFIDFEECTLTQIVGKNGTGKTSLIHIIEEILFNKNSKGIKKADIINRTCKTLNASLELSIDDVHYRIELKRTPTSKISLFENGEDISSHTATNTLKSIQKLIGMDFTTFTQLVYQNSKQGLEFLTSADSARKKFLISLFRLDKYTNYYEVFKKLYNNSNLATKELIGKQDVLSSWLRDHKSTDFTLLQPKTEIDDAPLHLLLSNRKELQDKLDNITQTNTDIENNNKYIEQLNLLELPNHIYTPPLKDDTLWDDKAVISTVISTDNKIIRDLDSLTTNECDTCKQTIDQNIKDRMIVDAELRIEFNTDKLNIITTKIKEYDDELKRIAKIERKNATYALAKNKINFDLPIKKLDASDLSAEIDAINSSYEDLRTQIYGILNFNKKVATNNAKIETLLTEMEKNRKSLAIVVSDLKELEDVKSKLDVLKTAFSTKGLVSYKIDFLVKDLQDKINEYLVELSEGRFQLNFILKADSINIGIVDNGIEVSISALSTGELSRVNVATLLAIRSLMSSLSNTKINLLFLDEIMGVLDEHGKTNLIDILINESDLNTFIVSHEYTHPLLEKINVIKSQKGSSLG